MAALSPPCTRNNSPFQLRSASLHCQPLQPPSIFSKPFYHSVSVIVKATPSRFLPLLVIDEHDLA
jgi:hypothetical protein